MRQKSLADALTELEKTARGLEYYHLASAEREMAGIESIQDDYEIIQPDKDVLVHANHYLTERFKKSDLVNAVVPDSLQRVETIKQLINKNYGRITLETMQEILADHENYPYSIRRHINEKDPYQSATLASFIMVPEDRMMYIAYGNPCESEYLEYKL